MQTDQPSGKPRFEIKKVNKQIGEACSKVELF
jgi:hypothetical protein